MIAEELPVALRLEERLAGLTICMREPDFAAMYENLGDRDVQEQIRQSSAVNGPKHCRWLMESSRACECLPPSMEDRAGEICPNNPYDKHRDEYAKLSNHRLLLSEAFRIRDLIELQMLPPPTELSPEEFHIARIMSQHRQGQQERRKLSQEMSNGQ